MLDGTGGPELPRTTVTVVGERITSVQPDDAGSIAAGARVVDASGKFLIPGLWDMHVHTFYGAGIYRMWWRSSRTTYHLL